MTKSSYRPRRSERHAPAGETGFSELRADFSRFLVAGGSAAAAHWLVLGIGVSLLRIEGTVATSAGFVVGATVSYLLNYFWTFRSTSNHSRALPRFLLVSVSGLGLNATIFATVHYGFAAHYLFAQMFATGLVLFWNFFLQRTWAFHGGVQRIGASSS